MRPTTAKTLITGNTYPVKESLKALGATWNPRARGWLVPSHHAAQARAIVASAGAMRRRPADLDNDPQYPRWDMDDRPTQFDGADLT